MQTHTYISDPPPRWFASPVAGISHCQGWTLCQMAEADDDGFRTTLYIARGPERDVVLDVSRFSFQATQARFDWFVRNGFPRREGIGPWDDHDVDLKIAAACLREMAGAA
jgi:hypothetical protein